MPNSPATVSASQVSLILERAAEIDARGEVITVEELRRIAAEAGIDAAATEIAIQEITADRQAAPAVVAPEAAEGNRLPAKNPKTPAPKWIVAGGAVGMVLGFFTALPGAVGIPAFGATVLYLVVRALKSMKSGSQLSFQLQNFAVWFGLAMGGSALGVEAFSPALVFWIVASVVGGLIVQFGPREEEPETEPPQLGATSSPPPAPSADR